MVELNPNQMLIVPALIALNEGLKKYFNLDTKWCVLVNWLLGPAFNITFSLAVLNQPDSILSTVLIGFLLGSAAGGIYDITKLIRGKTDGTNNN